MWTKSKNKKKKENKNLEALDVIHLPVIIIKQSLTFLLLLLFSGIAS